MRLHWMTKNFTWTKDAMDVLEKLWLEGVHTKDIAKILGLPTKSTVIGKAHRMGLPPHRGVMRPLVISVIPSNGKEATKNDFQRARVSHNTITRAKKSGSSEADIARKLLADEVRSQKALEQARAVDEPVSYEMPISDLSEYSCRWVTKTGTRDEPAAYCGHTRHTDPATGKHSMFCSYNHKLCYMPPQKYRDIVTGKKAA